MAHKNSHGSATLKGLIMLAVAVGVPFVLATRTSLPQRIDQFLVERRILRSDDYSWGGGDAPSYLGGNSVADVLAHSPPGVPIADSAVVPAGYAPATGLAAPAAGTQLSGGERFTAIEQRLRELGAVYFVLETRSLDPPRYRFLCTTARAGNQNVKQKFEATASSGLSAMEDVLCQVEQWHGGW
ncbi:MAG: hypothetical protein WEA31_07350 [Pirellulales bacterium]